MSELLIEKLDDLPSLMHLVQSAPASPRRFRGLVNNSLSMEETLQDIDHDKQKKKPPSTYSKHSQQIMYQASRRLKKDPTALKEKKKRDIGEIATLAKNGLMKKGNSNDPVNLFRNFDEGRNGYVTYEDFNQALLATNAGLSKNEISLLAQTLDQDHNGILDYTELTSSLTNISQKYALAIPSKSSDHSASSIDKQTTDPTSHSAPSSSLSSSAAATAPVDPVDEGYQRAYEYGQRYLKITQENQELWKRNEKKYYESLGPDIEIPFSQRIFHLSSLQPPRVGLEPTSNTSRPSYHRGSGKIPPTMADHLDGVLLPRPSRSSSRGRGSGDGPGGDDESESASSSYSDMYLRSRINRPENQETGIAKSYNGRHITGAGPLSTSVIGEPKGADCGGPVRSYERAFIGNPTNPTNRSSRDFSNAFIVDQAKPIRHKKRPSSAPPTSRSLESNRSLGNYLQQSLDSSSPSEGGTSLPPLPAEQINYDDHTTHHQRRHSTVYDQTKSSGVITALKVAIPTYESYLDTNKDRKKRVHPLSSSVSSVSSNSSGLHQGGQGQGHESSNSRSSLQLSLNTMLSQMNSYSKMKIFEHKMKQYDLSHSGYINKSEFVSSLSRSGIHLTPEQAHVIFESHAQPPQGAGTGTGGYTSTSLKLSDHDTRAIPISEFMNKLQTRISTPALQNKFLREKDHRHLSAALAPAPAGQGQEQGVSPNTIATNMSSTSSSSSTGNLAHTTTTKGPHTATASTAGSAILIETPLERNDLLNWKKLVNTLNSKQLDTKRSLELFKDLQINHRNEIPASAFLKELHSLGVSLNEIEYRNLISNVKKSSKNRNHIDLSDFCTQLHRYSEVFAKEEEMAALMPSLAHTRETLSHHAEVMKKIEKQCQTSNEISSMKRYIQQKKHFQQPATLATTVGTQQQQAQEKEKSLNEKRSEYLEIFQQTSSSHHHHPPTHHAPHQHSRGTSGGVPTCLLNGNSADTRKERLRWSKMKEMIVNKRNDLLTVFNGSSSPSAASSAASPSDSGSGPGSSDRLRESYTASQIRDKFSQVGIQLGDDDYKLFHSYVLQNTSASASASSKGNGNRNSSSLNFEQICDSLGVSVHTDTTRRPRAVCKEDCQRDGGIFGSSEKSLLSHPTYRVNMLSSSLDDTPHGKGNRKRHYDPITGLSLDPCATSQAKISTSEFWEFKHIPEFKALPGNLPPRSSNDHSSHSHSGYKYQGTSLREFQSSQRNNNGNGNVNGSRKRSVSAPPASSRSASGGERGGAETRKEMYLWQKDHPQRQEKLQQQGQGQQKPLSTRFASTPLAQYLKLKQGNLDSSHTSQQRHGTGHEPNTLLSHYAPEDHNATPMRTSELNSSFASSISFGASASERQRPMAGTGTGTVEGFRRTNIMTESHDFRSHSHVNGGNESSERETGGGGRGRGW